MIEILDTAIWVLFWALAALVVCVFAAYFMGRK